MNERTNKMQSDKIHTMCLLISQIIDALKYQHTLNERQLNYFKEKFPLDKLLSNTHSKND